MKRQPKCNVAVIGLGGIGSHFMDHINQLCGVGQFADWSFTIFDDDTVEPKNLQYQKFDDTQMGLQKADAVFENCLDIPNLNVEPRRATVDELRGVYDIVIIGSGTAGLSAALYSGRYMMKTLVIGENFGGASSTAGTIWNYPGVKAIDGYELMKIMKELKRKLKRE